MNQWFNQLNQREQLSVLALAVAVGLYLFYMVLWSPLNVMRDEMRERNGGTAAQLQRIETLVSEVQGLRDSGAGTGGQRNLTSILNQSTRRLNLQVSRFQPNSRGEIQVRLEGASFDTVMKWLYEIEFQQGLLVREVSITQASGVGLVNASVRIGQGA